MEFFTLGVYGSTEEEFFEKLVSNKIDVFLDIRQRRGVRGSKYAFVNSKRLQAKLNELGVSYRYILELAPTKEIRLLQKEADKEQNKLKRTRNNLGSVFSGEYTDKVLSAFDFQSFVKECRELNARQFAFFCVEEKPKACHRSLVIDAIGKLGYTVTNL